MPLPTPFSVTSSPIHMMRPVPAVSVMIMRIVVTMLSSGMIGSWQLGSSWPERASDTSVVALQQAEGDRQVTRVLRQLATGPTAPSL